MNVCQLPNFPQVQVSRTEAEADETTPEFISVKLVNNKARIRISPSIIQLDTLPSRAQLFTSSNTRGWFFAITYGGPGGVALAGSQVSHMRSRLLEVTDTYKELYTPQRMMQLGSVIPHYLAFALNDSRLIMGLKSGEIAVFDSESLCTPGTNEIQPLHTFSSPTGGPARFIMPNPGDLPELVAVLREPDGRTDSQLLEVLDVAKFQTITGWRSGGSPKTYPTSLAWSPKGKQLAIGLKSGDIITFSPTEPAHPKSFIPHPAASNGQSLVHATWLSNPLFYTMYAPTDPFDVNAEQTHIVISHDSKRNTALDTRIPLNFFPTAVRPPGAFPLVMRNWDPAKILMLMGDGTTADIGIIGHVAISPTEDRWQRITLEDIATPSMPLDDDSQETTMLGFELDLHNTISYADTKASGETVDLPPPPIAYAYCSDGTICAWFIINRNGTPYPGMLTGESSAPAAVSSPPALATPAQQPAQQPAQTTTSFPTPAPSSFGQPSGFGQPTSAFGQPSFGQPAFGQASSGSAFGQNAPSSSSAGGAFSAFATAGPSKFGQTGFGAFGSATPPAPTPAPAPPIQEQLSESMDDTPTEAAAPNFGFSGMSLGGDAPSQSNSGATGNNMFGSFGAQITQPAQPAASPTPPAPAPSSGFGQPSFGMSAANTAPAFGQSSFGSQPSFGQSSFGTKPASGFGAPAFGQSSFGSPSPSATPTAPASSGSAFGGGGGFGSYATSGLSSFGAAAKQGDSSTPAWKTTGSSEGVKSFGGGPQTVFGATAFGGQPSTPSPSVTPSAPTQMPPPPQTNVDPPMSSDSPPPAPPPAFATPASPPSEPTTPIMRPPKAPGLESPLSSPDSSPKPAPAPVPAPAPAKPQVTGNAFSGFKTTASPFTASKLSGTGFGVSLNEESPFMKAATQSQDSGNRSAFSGGAFSSSDLTTTTPAGKPPVSAFGQPSALGAQKSAFGQPAFGQSAFGQSGFGQSAFGKSAFGQSSSFSQSSSFGSEPATPSPPQSTTPASTTPLGTPAVPSGFGAFSAFSGGQSAFGKLAGQSDKPKPSFLELLKAGGQGDNDVLKSKATEVKKEEASTTPTTTPQKPPPVQPEASTTPKGKPEEVKGSSRAPTPPKAAATEELSQSTDSAASSFVDVSREEKGKEAEDGGTEQQVPPSPTSEDAEGEEYIDDTVDFLSDGYEPEEPPEEDEDEDDDEFEEEIIGPTELEQIPEEDEPDTDATETKPLPTEAEIKAAEEEKKTTVRPSMIPVPPSRSATLTPKPSIKIEPTTPEMPKTGSRAQSTTPPGSPKLQAAEVFQPTPQAPSPSGSPALGAAIGLGRPSTRPLRSSPLAGEAVAGDEETEKKATGTPPLAAPKPKPASPKPAFGSWGSPPVAPSTAGTSTSEVKPPTSTLFGADSATRATPPPILKPEPIIMPTVLSPPGTEKKSPRPKTPPLLSSFGFGKPSAPSSQAAPGTKAPMTLGSAFSGGALSGGSLFNKTPNSGAGSTTPPLGTKPAPPSAQPQQKTAFGSVFSPAPAPAPGQGAQPQKQVPTQTPLEALEEGMQRECAKLFVDLGKELEDLKKLAQEANKKREELIRPSPAAQQQGVPTMNDIQMFGKKVKDAMKEVEALEKLCDGYRLSVQEAESDLLKAKTRKEEIVRLEMVKADAEFARMLKTRSLNPEHMETQTLLRREIQAIRELVEKLEGHLQASKRKLAHNKTGKPGLKPPSLDTVNRTFRNIDIAIDQQMVEIKKLNARMSKLELDDASASTSSPHYVRATSSPLRDKRLPVRDDVSRRARDVTPNVAVTTAAALNAERFAHKLKDALLKARREPFLNTSASAAPAAPKAFESIQRSGPGMNLEGLHVQLTPSSPMGAGYSPPHGGRRSSGSRTRTHGQSVPLNRSGGSGSRRSPTPPASFDWGPLPSVKPMASLAADVRGAKV